LSQPVELPDGWRESQEDVPKAPKPTTYELSVWWRQLNDPILNELVERTIAGSVNLQIAVARVKEARARRGKAKSELGPSISASLSAARSEALGEQNSPSDSFSAGLDMVWEADLFGSKRLSMAASQADFEVETENLHAARISLIAETVVAYTDLRIAEVHLQVIDKNLSSRKETFQLTIYREQAGLASRLEANQALNSLSQTHAERPVYEKMATEARLRLNLLAGEMPGTFDELLTLPEAKLALPTPPNTVSVGIPADTLHQRPDVRAAERQLEATFSRLRVAKADRYPTFRLTGSFNAQSTELADLFDIDAMFANLLNGFTAPIFDSGRINNNITIRKAQWEQATLSYRSSVLEALSEVEKALSDYRLSQVRIAALEEGLQTAAEAAELAEQRYGGGLIDLLSVLDTQRTLYNFEAQLVTAKGELLKNFSNLYRALGGGWEPASQKRSTTGGSNA
jgi:NodT family efflux transporter outer membrane factor (OMF) lipoprotein